MKNISINIPEDLHEKYAELSEQSDIKEHLQKERANAGKSSLFRMALEYAFPFLEKKLTK